MALWSVHPFDRIAGAQPYRSVALAALGIAIIASFARNIQYLRIDNDRQLDLVARAEPLVGPDDVYFDGTAMLPNRAEPSSLWLDRSTIVRTLREGRDSEAYTIFSERPPKVILWSNRMDKIEPVIAPLLRDSYVGIAPNIRIAGRFLSPGLPALFDVPVAGTYALYDVKGEPLQARIEVDGSLLGPPFRFQRGPRTITLQGGTPPAFLLPQGSYSGAIRAGADDERLFADVYN